MIVDSDLRGHGLKSKAVMLFMKHRVNKDEGLSECGWIQLVQLVFTIQNLYLLLGFMWLHDTSRTCLCFLVPPCSMDIP